MRRCSTTSSSSTLILDCASRSNSTLALRERAEDAHSDMLLAKEDLNDETLRGFLEMLPDRAFAGISNSRGDRADDLECQAARRPPS
jgi:hypothetical protein